MTTAGKKVQVRQVRSAAGRDMRVKNTLQALGLGRIGKSQVLPLNASVEGMIRRVQHVLEVTEAK